MIENARREQDVGEGVGGQAVLWVVQEQRLLKTEQDQEQEQEQEPREQEQELVGGEMEEVSSQPCCLRRIRPQQLAWVWTARVRQVSG